MGVSDGKRPSVRVVSLVPSATESLSVWGVTPVACTRFCERPDLPHVGGTKDPDLDAIVALGPDLVVMCEEENLREHHERLVEAGLRTFVFRIDDVDDVQPQLAALAEVVGVERSMSDLAPPAASIAAAAPAALDPVVRAFVPIWRRPWMTLSSRTYGASLLRRLGVVNLFDDATVRYPEVTLEEVAGRRPDLILLPSEPYPFKDRHRAEVEGIAPAVLVDGQDLFWWGTRTPAALVRLGEVLDSVLTTEVVCHRVGADHADHADRAGEADHAGHADEAHRAGQTGSDEHEGDV